MKYIVKETEYQKLLDQGEIPLKTCYSNEQFIFAWFSEDKSGVETNFQGNLEVKLGSHDLFGTYRFKVDCVLEDIQEVTKNAYLEIFDVLSKYPEYQTIRFWNYVPEILNAQNNSKVTVYQKFNSGRYAAFRTFYQNHLNTINVPAASAVGTFDHVLKIEFFSSIQPVIMLENKNQIPAYQYSEKYGKLPPFFSRGAVVNRFGQRFLLSSGTASIIGETSLHQGSLSKQIDQSIKNLRTLSSEFSLKKYEIDYGFTLEDVAMLVVYYKNESDRVFLEKIIPEYVSFTCKIAFQHALICREELLVEIEAIFMKK